MLYEGGNSDALFSGEALFFLDFLIVGLSPGEGLVTSPEVSVLRLVRLVVWQSEFWGLAAKRHDGIGEGTERWHEGR